ncbi:MAG TPA: hypothetical protein DCQ90_06380 [Erysipelotrichaceae bacterium]|nr:hypothetical protein [Erysipelotrichaceae bacterium]
MEHVVVQLSDMLEVIGDGPINLVLSDFSCPLSDDVEMFFNKKALLFEKCDRSRTYFVFMKNNEKYLLAGYYTLAIGSFVFDSSVSINRRKAILGSHQYQKSDIPAVLLGQLGKNYHATAFNGALITGEKLLMLALKSALAINQIAGGRLIYLECKPEVKLMDFYTRHKFALFENQDGTPYKTPTDDLIVYTMPFEVIKETV